MKALPELVEANVITPEVAAQITEYYHSKSKASNRLVIVFGILGALLTGLGIILIIAHNWDQLSRPVKLSLALTPLCIGQVLCAFTLIRKSSNVVWREASSVFLLCAIASAIAIVSQVYNIHGDLGSFMLVWMLLSLPLIYITQSRVTSLLVICGITHYAAYVSYLDGPSKIAWYYWPMLAAILPFYYNLYKQKGSNFIVVHSWLLPISLTISLGMFARENGELMFIGYACMFSAFVLVSALINATDKRGSLAFNLIGTVGLLSFFLLHTFESFFRYFDHLDLASLEGQVSCVLFCLTVAMLIYSLRKVPTSDIQPAAYLFILFTGLFFVGRIYPHVAQVGCNLIVLSMALLTTRRGAKDNNLIMLNFGLVILAALVLCRFFDSEISFVVRGILFILVGFAFFAANFYTLKKRKTSQA
jgi:uncharacterized membrane protein